jgi:two-component system, OmpR family, response regulator CpxR
MGERTMANDQSVRILLIDDDREFADLVAEFLRAEGSFEITIRHDSLAGVATALECRHDLILLDVGFPGLNGFEVLRRVRPQVSTPVIMLTARGDDVDRILGLEAGADDYVPKPCNLRELAARIRAVTRRSAQRATEQHPEQLVVGDLRIESSSQSTYVGGEIVHLTATEMLVLEALAENAGQVVERDLISRHALGRRLLHDDRSVDVHIGNLRKKLGPLPDGRQRIKTVRGRGYLYVVVT